MKGRIRQRSAGSWELTVDLGRDGLGKRRRKYLTGRGTEAQARRKLREILSTLDRVIALRSPYCFAYASRTPRRTPRPHPPQPIRAPYPEKSVTLVRHPFPGPAPSNPTRVPHTPHVCTISPHQSALILQFRQPS